MWEQDDRLHRPASPERAAVEQRLKKLEAELKIQQAANQYLRGEMNRLRSSFEADHTELFRLIQRVVCQASEDSLKASAATSVPVSP